jgi:hypothetical protein
MNRNLSNITAADLGGAKTKPNQNEFPTCPAGKHVAKIIGFDEQENYNLLSVEIGGQKYNFFYNYFIYGTTDFDADVLNWIVGLSTIAVTENTSLIDITNSAIGSSYEIEIYNYTPKTGKNAGKPQHAIQFSTTPKLTVVEIESEEFVLPY